MDNNFTFKFNNRLVHSNFENESKINLLCCTYFVRWIQYMRVWRPFYKQNLSTYTLKHNFPNVQIALKIFIRMAYSNASEKKNIFS